MAESKLWGFLSLALNGLDFDSAGPVPSGKLAYLSKLTLASGQAGRNNGVGASRPSGQIGLARPVGRRPGHP